nr:hypothetical protein [Hymenobacter psoromatis]
MAETLATLRCRRVLEMTLRQMTKRAGRQLIHDSDPGIQYCSKEYLIVLTAWQAQVSLTKNSDLMENSLAEYISGIRKQQHLSQQQVCSLYEA